MFQGKIWIKIEFLLSLLSALIELSSLVRWTIKGLRRRHWQDVLGAQSEPACAWHWIWHYVILRDVTWHYVTAPVHKGRPALFFEVFCGCFVEDDALFIAVSSAHAHTLTGGWRSFANTSCRWHSTSGDVTSLRFSGR